MKAIRIRRALLALAVVLSVLLVLTLLGTLSAYREMRHEGLTYSQWYEGSIEGFYSCLLAAVACAGLCAAAWAALARQRKPRVKRGAHIPWLIGTAALLTALFIALSIRDHRALQAARAENVESLAPYLRACGVSRVGGLISLEALAAAVAGRIAQTGAHR